MGFTSMEEMIRTAQEAGIPLWKAVMENDCKERRVTEEKTIQKMRERYDSMKRADADYEEEIHSLSGLSGGDGARMQRFVREERAVSGNFMGTVIAGALKMGESNACMKRIVAAPTAGACGVVPAVFLAYEQFYQVPEELMPGGLKETSQAGLAATETGKKVALDLAQRNQTSQC